MIVEHPHHRVTIAARQGPHGYPKHATCTCGQQWTAPEWDHDGDTIASWGRQHRMHPTPEEDTNA